MNLQVVIENGEDGYVVASCPALPSCWSQGETCEEALANIREAISVYLERAPAEVDARGDREIVELTI
ncbi:MAG TPA: type II toxin-antitoxin system HicB family antitoxin [Chthoniobacterales bacterium]|nr:type II toxin-antitoxin system HicB family antitoxin [Chthoniobacterales bacterium]